MASRTASATRIFILVLYLSQPILSTSVTPVYLYFICENRKLKSRRKSERTNQDYP